MHYEKGALPKEVVSWGKAEVARASLLANQPLAGIDR